jgi:hypothetical protein
MIFCSCQINVKYFIFNSSRKDGLSKTFKKIEQLNYAG